MAIRTAAAALKQMKAIATPARAKALARFFKTGPGEYGEGDEFLGVTMQQLRTLAKEAELPVDEADALLASEWHEARMLALLALVRAYHRGDEETRARIYELFLARTARINNWDLIDVTVEHVIGRHLLERSREPLFALARSSSLWERRIAVLSTFAFIKRGEAGPTLRIAEMLLEDEHDLIHKGVGWMLREIGEKCSKRELTAFLDRHAATMPRTMLRYALEKLPAAERRRYMSARAVAGGARASRK